MILNQEYKIREDFLNVGKNYNRPGQSLNPEGITLHETATPNATDENESKYFHNAYRSASAHYFVDYDSITQLIPENEVSWHAGYTANHKFISIEMCHFQDENKFQETWNRTVWLVVNMCKRYNWNPDEKIVSHKWVSDTYKESDHTDPYGYFKEHGKTFDDIINDVKKLLFEKEIDNMAEQWQEELGLKNLNELVQKGIINNVDEHKDKMGDNVPYWLLLTLINRIVK